MRRAAAWLIVGIALVSCSQPPGNPPDPLPRTVRGASIAYERIEGSDLPRRYAHHIALEVAEALAVPLDSVTIFIGRTDASGYRSDIIQVRGVDTEQLLGAVVNISTMNGDRRVDNIAGKSVIRAAPLDFGNLDDAPYYYAFGDTAIILVGDKALIEATLRQIP